MTAPSKMGRKHNSNLITTGSRHIFTNFLGGSKPPPYNVKGNLITTGSPFFVRYELAGDRRSPLRIVGIFQSVRSTHFFSLFSARQDFCHRLLCLIFAYASYFSACKVNILAYVPPRLINSSCEPDSMISPFSIT